MKRQNTEPGMGNKLRWIALAALMGCLAGCGASFQAATPPGFVELEEDNSEYAYRATTADGLVMAVRELDNEVHGQLDFWSRAIENELRFRGGYALLGTKDVKTAGGLAGKRLRFGHDEGQRPHLYEVNVFVTSDHIYLLEVGGSKELVEKHQPQLDWAVQNFSHR